jgi:hypothetical protein
MKKSMDPEKGGTSEYNLKVKEVMESEKQDGLELKKLQASLKQT